MKIQLGTINREIGRSGSFDTNRSAVVLHINTLLLSITQFKTFHEVDAVIRPFSQCIFQIQKVPII